MPRRRSDRDGLRRRPAFREPKRRILILCEGEQTEPLYLQELGRVHRSLVEVRVEGRGEGPRTLVRAAVERKRLASREAARFGDPHLAYDEVWCVFDVDEHHHLPEARDQARANGVELAISNPCFELWALLHFQDQTAHLSREAARSTLKVHLPRYAKVLPYGELETRRDAAVGRAESLDRQCERDGEPCRNPSTGVYRLVVRIARESAGVPARS